MCGYTRAIDRQEGFMPRMRRMGTANLDRQIRNTIESFVEELSALVRSAAVQSVTEAFGGSPSPARRGRPPGTGARSPKPSARTKGQKRAPQDLEALIGRLLDAIRATPGQRMEQIAKELQSSTQELALPAKKLIADKRVKTKGDRRATKTFPV